MLSRNIWTTVLISAEEFEYIQMALLSCTMDGSATIGISMLFQCYRKELHMVLRHDGVALFLSKHDGSKPRSLIKYFIIFYAQFTNFTGSMVKRSSAILPSWIRSRETTPPPCTHSKQ